MASYRRDPNAQNAATANVGPATTVLAVANAPEFHATMPEILAVLDDGDGVDLGDIDAAQNAPPPNVGAPTPCTTPYAGESISRNF